MGSGGHKWLGFVTAIWVQVTAGNNYTFANYSVALKAILGLNQLQLNNLSVAKDGESFRCVCFFAWGGNNTTWMNTAMLVTCMRNFSKNRGPVVGILKGYIGLSTAIFTDICSVFFANNPSLVLLMLTLIPRVVCFAANVFMKPTPSVVGETTEREEVNSFYVLNILAIVMAVYLLAFDMSGEHGVALSRIFVGFLLLLLAAPLIVPAKLLIQRRAPVHPGSNPGGSLGKLSKKQITEPLLETTEGNSVSVVTESTPSPPITNQVRQKLIIGEDHTIFEAMQKFDFLLLFFAFLYGVGTVMN